MSSDPILTIFLCIDQEFTVCKTNGHRLSEALREDLGVYDVQQD